VARRSTLKPYPEDIAEGLAHVDALSAALADYAAKVRAAIATADRLGDADSADLFTGISRETDKYLWFLEAHLHAKR
jgi:starvation-inducible DNA-binding protein